MQLLQCYLRAAELEMRAAKEPFRSGLRVAGPKAQVLWRIEELEARERQREELLTELIPEMEARGHGTGGREGGAGRVSRSVGSAAGASEADGFSRVVS